MSARELRHGAAEVVRSVADGERLILTRYGTPQAVVLSLRDSMELLALPDLADLAAAAASDFEDGRLEVPWPEAGPVGIVLSQAAAAVYRRLGPRDRGGLRRALSHGRPDPNRPLWLESGRRLVAFSYPEPRTALVHALIEARPLERELIGEEIWRAVLRRDLDRNIHSRAAWQR